MRESLDPGGVGYLYTVIGSSIEKECPVFLACDQPAVLFFNGVRVFDHDPDGNFSATEHNVSVMRGLNDVLVKIVGDQSTRMFFKLGDDNNLVSDEFNNNLWELVSDFGDLQERSRRHRTGEMEEIQKIVTLRFTNPEAHSVSVIGTFNGWSPDQSRMRRSVDGTWEITLSLRPGKYAYRYLINSRKQVLDPRSQYEEPDGYGGKNSVIFVMQ